jgi:hypothetical protein
MDTKRFEGMPESTAYQLKLPEFVGWLLYTACNEAPRGFQTPMWTVARHMKGFLGEAFDAGLAWQRLNKIVRRDYGGWEKCTFPFPDNVPEERFDDMEADFIHSWESCNCPGGSVKEALRRAGDRPLHLKKPHNSEGCGRFVSVLGHMASMNKDGVVALSTRKIGDAMGCRPNTVSIWIKWCVKDGYLTLTRKHVFNPKHPETARAAEYKVSRKVLDAVGR